jgi:acyl-coenzyme A synthetase/AMP-(fatty) acid ligase
MIFASNMLKVQARVLQSSYLKRVDQVLIRRKSLLVQFVKKYSRASLRVLGTVGEPINPKAWW